MSLGREEAAASDAASVIGNCDVICRCNFSASLVYSAIRFIVVRLDLQGFGRKRKHSLEFVRQITSYKKADMFRGIIASFNVNTNKWVQNYMFKRLKFLGSKVWIQLCHANYIGIASI